MIKNRPELFKNLSPKARRRRKILLDIVDYVVAETTSARLLEGKIWPREVKKFDKVVVFAIGKAARTMVEATLPYLGRKPDYVVIADSGHPLPTRRGQLLTQKIEKIARSLGERDLAIVLLSGGGSAMFVDPVSDVTLEDKAKTTHALLKCGASINEINIVRKHLSRVKGGRLAAMLYPAHVWGFVISDVIGDDLSTIASGPLSPDPTTFQDALHILKKYTIAVPSSVKKYLEKGISDISLETPKPGEKYFKKVQLEVIADHSLTVGKAFVKAKMLGIKTYMYPNYINGEARDAAERFMKMSQEKKYDLYIASGETTVTCRGDGYGGRNQEFVLAGLPYLHANQTLLSIGTDGIDGICPEKIAGALGDNKIIQEAQKQKLSLEKFLKNNDSYTFFKKAGGLLKTGPTGTNLGDLILLVKDSA